MKITKTATGTNGTNYFIHTGYTLQPYFDQIPEEYEDTLRSLVGQGVSPKSVIAAVELLENQDGRTQKQVALDNDVCEVTIRKVRDRVVEHEASPVQGDEV